VQSSRRTMTPMIRSACFTRSLYEAAYSGVNDDAR
jgi:hypothetical protein